MRLRAVRGPKQRSNMPDTPFPILGTSVPPMLGRTAILQRVLGALTKPAPDHLQVVGPRFGGKTVLLREVASQLQQRVGKPYTAVLLWDLGHQTPATDDQFMQSLARELGAALKSSHPDCTDLLLSVQEGAYQDIAEVLDLLAEENAKVLMIMDGFDKPLSQGGLTRNLWDQLRELAIRPSLRLVTASRRKLGELIRNPQAQTSDLWNIFNPRPVKVGCFDSDDLGAVLAALPSLRLEVGAQKELLNATNGFPVLTLSVLNELCDAGATGLVTPQMVNAACDDALDALRDTLDALWQDCPPSSQDLLRRVMDESSVLQTGEPGPVAETLIQRGFVHHIGNKLERPNRLLRRYLNEQPNEGSALARMFGTADAYERNLKGALERRIENADAMDPTLRRYLTRGVEDLPSYPEVFLGNVSGILDQSLKLVWRAECWNTETQSPHIPSEWFSVWDYNGDRKDDWRARFPEGGQRLRLLDLMTGTQKHDRLARYVTKNVYVLANAVQGFRDYGAHTKSSRVEVGTGYAALHVCIELGAALARELPRSA